MKEVDTGRVRGCEGEKGVINVEMRCKIGERGGCR